MDLQPGDAVYIRATVRRVRPEHGVVEVEVSDQSMATHIFFFSPDVLEPFQCNDKVHWKLRLTF